MKAELSNLESYIPQTGRFTPWFSLPHVLAVVDINTQERVKSPFYLDAKSSGVFVQYSEPLFEYVGRSFKSFMYPHPEDLQRSKEAAGGSYKPKFRQLTHRPYTPDMMDAAGLTSLFNIPMETAFFVDCPISITVTKIVVSFPFQLLQGAEGHLHQEKRIEVKSFRFDMNTDSNIWLIRLNNLVFYSLSDSDVRNNTAGSPFLVCEHAAFRETPNSDKSTVDIFASDITGKWTPILQLELWKVIQNVTYSVWVGAFHVYECFMLNCDIKNPALEDEAHVKEILDYLKFSTSTNSDSLMRLMARNVCINATFEAPALPSKNVGLSVEVGEFSSSNMPDQWSFNNVLLSINGATLLKLEQASITHCADNDETKIYGWLHTEARCRLRAIANKSSTHTLCEQSDLLWAGAAESAMTGNPIHMVSDRLQDKYVSDAHLYKSSPVEKNLLGDEGWKVSVEGIAVSVPTNFPLVEVFDDIGWQAQALVTGLFGFPKSGKYGYFQPHTLPNFYNYFMLQPKPSWPAAPLNVWLSVTDVKAVIVDKDSMSPWLETIKPLWVDEYEQRHLREKLFDHKIRSLKLMHSHFNPLVKDLVEQLKVVHSSVYVQRAKKLMRSFSPSG